MIDIKYNGNETVYIQTEEQKISTLYSSLTCTWELAYIIAKEGIEINFNFENATYEEILDLKECIEKTKTQETDKIIKICGDSDNEYRVKIKTEYTSKGIIKQTYKDNEYKLQDNQTNYIEQDKPTEEEYGYNTTLNDDEEDDSGFSFLKDLL